MNERAAAGAAAEERAARYLEARGYEVLARNFRCRAGELDIVARDGETVVFVEVRSRAPSGFGSAAETVGWSKRAKLLKAARYFAHVKALDCPMRFDVVAIDGSALDHIEDAFQAA